MTGRRNKLSRGVGRLKALRRSAVPALMAVLAGCGAAPDPDNRTARQTESERSAPGFMVSTAHPLATQAGLAVLRNGGNAVDAAIAVQMVLGFVEPPETGIGGGGFLLYRDGNSGEMQFYDGRETAPANAGPDLFTLFGWPVPTWAAVPSGRAVGVPGLLAMLERAHTDHGSLPWSDLLQPAIAFAEHGVPMPRRLQQQIAEDRSLKFFKDTQVMFSRPAEADEPVLHNPALAATLRELAAQGPRYFYHSAIGDDVVARAAARPLWPGRLTSTDLRDYQAELRAPVCGQYRGWTICGAPPPSSGGIALLQILGALERFPLDELGPDSAESVHLIAEASRLAFADRQRHVGDPAYVDVPAEGLTSPGYVAARGDLIDPAQAMKVAHAGEPGFSASLPDAEFEPEDERFGTSHFSIVDGDGNAVALTSSNEAPFGTRMTTRGFLLNNQLTDFSFSPLLDGQPHPNAVAPGKRPRSSMSPVLVFDPSGELRLVLGSRGGARIIGYVAKTLIGVIDWGLDIQDAIALPNFLHRGEVLELERGTPLEQHRAALEAKGHRVSVLRLTSGLHGIERTPDGWRGGADPRLDGIAAGG